MYIFGESYVKYSYYAYSKPYCRVPAYLVGMAFGFVNESWASDPSKVPDFSRSQGASFLAAAFVALLACVFAPLSDYRDPESWPPWANGAFLSLVRPTWAAALGVLTTSCALGFTPTLNAFLAAPAWTPFARLTFGAYLFHPVAIKWFAGTATSTYHFSIHHVLSDAAFNAVCAFACAAVTWLVVERPTMSATSGLTSRRRAGALRKVIEPVEIEEARAWCSVNSFRETESFRSMLSLLNTRLFLFFSLLFFLFFCSPAPPGAFGALPFVYRLLLL